MAMEVPGWLDRVGVMVILGLVLKKLPLWGEVQGVAVVGAATCLGRLQVFTVPAVRPCLKA